MIRNNISSTLRKVNLSSNLNGRFYSSMGIYKVPEPYNEPNQEYGPESATRVKLSEAIADLQKELPKSIPLIINGKRITTTETEAQFNPFSHGNVVANASRASEEHVSEAISSAQKAKIEWENTPFNERVSIFLKAADLISTKYKYKIMAATILGQGKNAYQAEIDASAELIDFLKFNAKYAEEMYSQQPIRTSKGIWNRADYRPLEGFVYAVTPFNFTAIAGNLVAAPAIVGNTVLWKPSPHAVLSGYILYQILEEAGLPDGVINFIPGDPITITKRVLSDSDFGALHYTGSTNVFKSIYKQIANNVDSYKSYPRIVGETGGKNFHVIHPSANINSAAKATVRGAFEYQGQKCSATSRVYVPESVWAEFKSVLLAETELITSSSSGFSSSSSKTWPLNYLTDFSGPVIHRQSFDKLSDVLSKAKKDSSLEIIAGGFADDSVGFFVEPTIIRSKDINHSIFKQEFFGPVLAVYVYPDSDFENILSHVDETSVYGLTGSIFAKDRDAVQLASNVLRHTAGNFYINDKCTGAVVGQQWFGGSRLSGTNDKAGSGNILTRFVSIRNIKENFLDTETVLYPSNK